MWWYTPVISTLRKLKQKDHYEFKSNLGYIALATLPPQKINKKIFQLLFKIIFPNYKILGLVTFLVH